MATFFLAKLTAMQLVAKMTNSKVGGFPKAKSHQSFGFSPILPLIFSSFELPLQSSLIGVASALVIENALLLMYRLPMSLLNKFLKYGAQYLQKALILASYLLSNSK